MIKYFISATAILLVIFSILFAYLYIKQKRNRKNKLFEEEHKNRKNRMYVLYRMYMVTPVVKRYLRKIKDQYRSIFPADEITINIMATKQMTKSLLISIAIMVLTILLSKGDIPYAIVGLVGSYIVFTMVVNSSAESLNRRLLDQLDSFITDVHANYHDSHDVEDAIESSMDNLPYEISLHADKILNIVNSTDSELEMEKYINIAPNQFLLLMAAICSSVSEYGDKVLENGKSLFVTNLTYLKEVLSDERIMLKKKHNEFMGMSVGVLIPLFILKPIELMLLKMLPDIESFFKGFGGLVSLSIITLIALVSHEFINILKDSDNTFNNDDDTSRLLRVISEIGFVKKFLTLKTNKNYTKALKITDWLKSTGDKDGLNVFTVRRYVWAIVLFVLVNIVCFTGVLKDKLYVVKTFNDSFSQEIVPNEAYRKTMQDVSVSLYGKVKDPSNIKAEVEKYVIENGLNERMITPIAKEVESKIKQHDGYKYKWYYLMLSYIAAVIGYYIPYLLLKYKRQIMGLKREDEVSQFRTLILILMHEDGMTIDTVLEWMERFAKTFKATISECIMNLEYDLEEAIETMKERENGFQPFRNLCKSLIAVDSVGFENAFDDLEAERSFYRENRKEDVNEIIKRNSRSAGLVMLVPVVTTILLYLIVPFGLYALKMLAQFGGVLE